MAIDGDGARNIYGPPGTSPLDYLANAGHPGNWYGVVTDNGQPNGDPVIQGPDDPYPGYYVSATSYKHADFERKDPRAYVDSNAVPFIVLPSHWRKAVAGVVLGCKAQITDTETGIMLGAVVADFGPKAKTGEASIAAAKFFGVPHSPKNGGTDEKRFNYQFWPGIAAEGFELQPV
jgi:hypothetical protein